MSAGHYYEIETKSKTEEDEWHPCGQTAETIKGAWNLLANMRQHGGNFWNYRLVKVIRRVLK